MSVKFKIWGHREMKANLETLAKKSARAQMKALHQVAQEEMTESKKLVPVDTGTLKNSGHVEQPKRIGDAISVELGYGGAAEDYAIPVHEDLEAFHRVGQAKYLEQPLNESAPHIATRVFKKAAEDLGL